MVWGAHYGGWVGLNLLLRIVDDPVLLLLSVSRRSDIATPGRLRDHSTIIVTYSAFRFILTAAAVSPGRPYHQQHIVNLSLLHIIIH